MRDALDRAMPAGGEPITIRFGPIRNQSRAESRAFDSMALELRSLLELSALAGGLTLSTAPNDEAEFQLHATVYLLRVEAIDMWETYFTLRRAADASPVWQSAGPTRMSCIPRAEEPRIIYPPRASRLE